MKNLLAYLKLFRWHNLLFIAGLMFFFRQFILIPIFEANLVEPQLSALNFFLMVLATLMIGAGGYAINDYFDLRKDRINQPDTIVVGRLIPRRSVILWQWVLNTAGGIIGIFISWYVKFFPLAVVFFLVPFLLWLYGFAIKRWFVFGNLFISALSALIVYLVCAVELAAAKWLELPNAVVTQSRFYTMMYGGLLFFMFLALEVFKDFFDYGGDRKTGVRSIPVVLGIPMARNVFLGLLIASIQIAGIYVFWLSKNFHLVSVAFFLLLVVVPLGITIFQTLKPIEEWEPKKSQSLLKVIFVFIVLSMVVQYFYII